MKSLGKVHDKHIILYYKKVWNENMKANLQSVFFYLLFLHKVWLHSVILFLFMAVWLQLFQGLTYL